MKVRYEMDGDKCLGWQQDAEGESLDPVIAAHVGPWLDENGPMWKRNADGTFERLPVKKVGFFKRLIRSVGLAAL